MKRLLSVFLALILMCSTVVCGISTVSAETDSIETVVNEFVISTFDDDDNIGGKGVFDPFGMPMTTVPDDAEIKNGLPEHALMEYCGTEYADIVNDAEASNGKALKIWVGDNYKSYDKTLAKIRGISKETPVVISENALDNTYLSFKIKVNNLGGIDIREAGIEISEVQDTQEYFFNLETINSYLNFNGSKLDEGKWIDVEIPFSAIITRLGHGDLTVNMIRIYINNMFKNGTTYTEENRPYIMIDDLCIHKVYSGEFKTNEAENVIDDILVTEHWAQSNNRNFSGGLALYTQKGGKVKFAFDGNYFELVSYKSPSQGKIYIKIDNGEEFLAADLYADEYDKYMKSVVYRSDISTDDTHTVEIRAEGKAYLDAINVLGDIVKCDEAICEVTTYEAENSAIEINGNWNTVATWSFSNHKAVQGLNGASANFTYTGYGFDIVSYKSMTQGKMFVSIDGSKAIEVNLYDAFSVDYFFKDTVFSKSELSYGTHTVEITTSGKVYLDAVKIDGTLN